MGIPLIQPDKGQAVHINSVLEQYRDGLISFEGMTWAHLVGLDIFDDINSASEAALLDAVLEDTDRYVEKMGHRDSLHKKLRKGAGAFRFWWAAESRLNDCEDFYEACGLLAERGIPPSDYILERAGQLYCNSLTPH